MLGACSPSGGTDRPTAEDTGSASLLVQQTGDGESTTSTSASTTAPSTTTAATGTTTSGAPSTSTNTLPGGTAPTAALAEAGYLRGERVALDALREAAATGSFADSPGDSGEGAALPAGAPATDLCDYLFGTATEVAALTRLAGTIHLAAPSGPRLTADDTSDSDDGTLPGLLIVCVYADDDGAQLVLQVSDGPPIDPDLPGQPIIVTGGSSPASGPATGTELEAVISYNPDRTAPRIDSRTARDWLTAALGRVTTGG